MINKSMVKEEYPLKTIRALRIIIIPLIFFEFFFFNFKIGPIHITSLRVALVIAIITLFFTLFNKKIILPNTKYIKFASVFLYVWLFYSVFQLLYVQDFSATFNRIFYLLIYFIIILVFITVNDKQEWESLMKVISWIGVIIIVICLWEIITGSHLPTSRFYVEEMVSNRKANGVFYNENDLGLFFVMIFPLVYYNDSKKFKLFKVSSLVCIPVIILLNDNKAALISIAIQIVFMILFSDRSRGFKLKVFLFFVLAAVVFSGQIIEIFIPIMEQLIGGYGSASVRLDVYIKGLYALRKSNYLGVGPGNFGLSLTELFGEQLITDPHSWWVELLVNSGVVIFCLYLVFFVGMIIETYKIYRENKKENRLVLSITIAFIGFIMGSFGPSTAFDKTFVWLFYGMGLGAINIFHNKSLISDKQGSIIRRK